MIITILNTLCIITDTCRGCQRPGDVSFYWVIRHLNPCNFKWKLLCKNHVYKVFEHSCVASVCENNQPVMVKIHTLIFIRSKKIINSLSEWAVSDSPSIEPLMADGASWRCFSFFSGLWQCNLLGSQWDSHKPPGSHPKYLKLCSEDDEAFTGLEQHGGKWHGRNHHILWRLRPW